MREHVGTDQNTALGFGSEPFITALFDHVLNIFIFSGTVTVAHTVKTREVGTCLSAGHNVVNRHTEIGVGQINIHNLCPLRAVLGNHLLNCGGHFRIQRLRKPGSGHTDAGSLNTLFKVTGEVFGRHVFACGIPRFKPDHVTENPGNVFNAVRHQTGRIKA